MAGLPQALKPIQPFLMVAKQFEKKDPVVAYYVKVYSVQEGIQLCKANPGAKGHLLSIMDQLDQLKKIVRGEDAISDEDVGKIHMEEVALKLFKFADQQDRASKFGRNMIKAFFTASQLFVTLQQFGELSDGIPEKMKYAKWKAVEIDRCLKSGIEPTPGPPGGFGNEEDEFGEDQSGAGPSSQPPPASYDAQPGPSSYGQPGPSGYGQPGPSGYGQPPPTNYTQPPAAGFNMPPPTNTPYPPTNDSYPSPQPRHALPPDIKPIPKPRQEHTPSEYHQDPSGFQHEVPEAASGVQLGPGEITQAQKYCKFAASSLEYEDVKGAMDFLEKAMKLLKTGKK